MKEIEKVEYDMALADLKRALERMNEAAEAYGKAEYWNLSMFSLGDVKIDFSEAEEWLDD